MAMATLSLSKKGGREGRREGGKEGRKRKKKNKPPKTYLFVKKKGRVMLCFELSAMFSTFMTTGKQNLDLKEKS